MNRTTRKHQQPGDTPVQTAAKPAANASAPKTSTLDPQLIRAIAEELRQVAQPAHESPIIGFSTLLERLGDCYGERGLRDLVADGIIPSIRPPKVRKLAFFWPGVVEALRRHERGVAV